MIAIIITITLLIIDLPDGNDMRALVAVLPLAACYLISFILDGVNGVNQHHALVFSVQARLSSFCAREG